MKTIIITIFLLTTSLALADPRDDADKLDALMESSLVQNNKINRLEQSVEALSCEVQVLKDEAAGVDTTNATCPTVVEITKQVPYTPSQPTVRSVPPPPTEQWYRENGYTKLSNGRWTKEPKRREK